MDPNVEMFNSLHNDGNYGPDHRSSLPEDCVSIAFVDQSGSYDTDVHILAKNAEGYWAGEAGGCSCYTAATVVGPFATQEEALANISQWRREEIQDQLKEKQS